MTDAQHQAARRPIRLLTWTTLQGVTRSQELTDRDVTIGRGHGVDLSFAARDISRRQCTLLWRDEQFRVRHDGDTASTFVNGQEVTGERLLEEGDVIALGASGQVEITCRAAVEIKLPRTAEGGSAPLAAERMLLAVVAALSSTLDLREVFALLVEAASRLTAYPGSEVLIEGAEGELEPHGSVGGCSNQARRVAKSSLGRCSRVVKRLEDGRRVVALPMRAFTGNRLSFNRDTGSLRAVGVLLAESGSDGVEAPEETLALLQVACDVAAVHVAYARLFEQERHDVLTGLLSRGALFRELSRHVRRAAHRDVELSFALFDIDHFKRVNDTHGHPAGDVALRHVAKQLRDAIGEQGAVFRYGGEEMAALIPGAPFAEAAALVERARAAVEAREVSVVGTAGQATLHLTVSAGVAPWSATRHAVPDDLVADADNRLLEAKASGRNRVVASQAEARAAGTASTE